MIKALWLCLLVLLAACAPFQQAPMSERIMHPHNAKAVFSNDSSHPPADSGAWDLQVSWNLAVLPMQCELPEGHSLHLMRIVQEALTNACRHAGADWIEVRATLLSDAPQAMARIEIIDNGCGWDIAPDKGHGLNHMHKRAEMMGAELKVTAASDNGVHISLTVPIAISA